MKRVLYQLFILSFLLLSGCGYIEQGCDESNYESLSNERGTIELYSGGILLSKYENAKVIYSDSNSLAVWFETKEGDTIYWQGEMKIFIK